MLLLGWQRYISLCYTILVFMYMMLGIAALVLRRPGGPLSVYMQHVSMSAPKGLSGIFMACVSSRQRVTIQQWVFYHETLIFLSI